ncbi:MAG: restriction endonuclease [Patescibacteria group bacterium]|nr:restriction endonuclease [Patescibacteria group bacterium]
MKEIYVINLMGRKESFSSKKVFNSARRAGASEKLAQEIALKIQEEVFPGMKTSEIFKKVKQLLKQGDKSSSLRFSLKEAMRKLGPSGFPFEKYIGDIFSAQGFKILLNQKINGQYARHEIDFLAEKNKLLYVGECKFRMRPGERIDLGIILAIHSRFLDLQKGNYFRKFKGYKIKPILVTNAKFSSQAKRYSKGVGIELLGWNYPLGKGLEYIIEEKGLYPITILPSLTSRLMEIFANEEMMIVQDVLEINIKEFCGKYKIKENKILSLISEAKILIDNYTE